MAEPKDLVVNGFEAGFADSPYAGFADMRCVTLDEKPGAALINFKTTKESATTITGLPRWAVINPSNGDIYLLDDDGKLYISTDDGDSWTLITGNTLPAAGAGGHGLAIWKSYVFVARATNLDVYNIGTPAWSNSWQTIDDGAFHPMIATQDDKLTGGAGRYIFTVQETSGSTFAPGTGASYTFTAQKLVLPAQYKIKCLAELGLDLKIGTWQGTNLYDVKVASIFSWDRVSTSFAGSRTLNVNENGISAMQTANGILYFVAGTRCNLYETGGGTPVLVKEWKAVDLTTTSGSNLAPLPGAIMFHRNKIYVGVAGGAGGTPLGVYSYNPKTRAAVLEHILSTGSVASTIKIGLLFSATADLGLLGWQNSSAQGVDLIGKDNKRYTSYAAYIDSPFYRVGTPTVKRAFSEMHVILGRKLASGQGIRVSWRSSLEASFTAIATVDFATYGAVSEIAVPGSIGETVGLQFRIELTTGGDTDTTPELLELRFR